MATLGVLVGVGYVSGKGQGRIFTDLDNSKFLFFLPNNSDERIYCSRSQVRFRRPPKKAQ